MAEVDADVLLRIEWQLSSKIEPETGTTTMFYNSDGTVHYKLDAKGQKVQMTYDASKRVSVIKKYPDGVNEDACQRVEMFYDGNYPADGDAGVTSNAYGRLSAVRSKGANCTLLNGHTYVEQYSYLNYGAMTKKRLKVIRNLSSGTASGVLESVAEYDGEGRLLAVTYPVTGKRYQYGFDSRGLPSSLTNTTDSTTLVSSVVYGVAGEMTTFVHGGGTETRSYNDNGQMTMLNLPGRTISYTFPSPGANNGKVASITDSGETIAYVYDSLQRLTSATGSGWSQGFQYDGFGNMNNKTATGGAPTWSASIDPATNRISTTSYDANGNQTFITTTTGIPDSFNLSYDVSNRLTLAVNAGPSIRSDYGYDPGNKRIWEKRTLSGFVNGEWFYFFGVTGQRLARYNFTVAGAAITFTQDNASVWFRGKLVQKINTFGSSFANEDRLGSVGKYMPYGEDKPGATNPTGDNEKFATYTRDAANGLDYADQRWHAQGTGRFLTSDPYQTNNLSTSSRSWNRYAYVGGNPTNSNDTRGLIEELIEGCGKPGTEYCIDEGPGPGPGPGQGDCFYEQLLPNPHCYYTPPPPALPPPPAPPPPDAHALCMVAETLYIAGYLAAHRSPLAAYSGLIVGLSDAFGLDDRFIVALAGVETSYGTDVRWGPNNVFNNGAHRPSGYPSLAAAILDVIKLLAEDKRYTPYSTTSDIYSVYERGDPDDPSPGQRILDTIFRALGGDVSNIRRRRCP